MAFYEEFSQYYDDIFPVNENRLSFLKDQFKPVKGGRILDVGTGTGTYALALANSGYSVIGIDLDEEMLSRARDKAGVDDSNIEFQQMNMLEIEQALSGNFAGIMVIGNVLVHLNDQEEIADFLRQTANILSPGGRLVIQIINYDRILDQGITELTPILNQEKKVSLSRNYRIDSDQEHVEFKTRLAVEKAGIITAFFNSVRLNALRSSALEQHLQRAGFKQIKFYGDFHGRIYDPEESIFLVVTAVT